jgi:drug/metabolite transporter (DMT)-like permease
MDQEAKQATEHHASGRAYALLVFTTLCWGGNAILGRLAVGEISPMLLVGLRWIGVMILMLVIAPRHVRRDWPLLRPLLPLLAAMGALGFAAFTAIFYYAAHYTTAVNIGIIQGAMPVFVMLGAFAVYRTPVRRIQMLGVAVTLIGVVTVASGGSLQRLMALTFNRGDILLIIDCTLYAFYALGLQRRPAVSSLSLFAVFACAAFVVSLPLAGAEYMLGYSQWPTPTGWLITGLVILFPSFISQLTFMKGVALIGPGRASLFVNLVPVFAAILAVVILGEPFHIYHALALALVLGGIWLAERVKQH